MSRKINTETTFVAFHISKSDAMNAKITSNINVAKKLPNQHTSERTNFEGFFISFKHELRAYEESDKMDCLMFSTVDYFRFKVDLYHSFNPKCYQRYIKDLILFENQDCCYCSCQRYQYLVCDFGLEFFFSFYYNNPCIQF